MNRLWVRISLVIALVAVIITLFPLAARRLWLRPEGLRPTAVSEGLSKPASELSDVQITRIQEDAGERAWWLAWSTVAFGAIVGLGVGIWLSRGLVKPLVELEKGANEVAHQNLAYRVPEAGTRETQTVAHAFNEMATELEQAQTLRRNMLADVTHELRHPVHVLGGSLQGIIDGVFPLDIEEVVILSEQTTHLARLIEDLHELALAEAHELPLHKQETVLNDLVKGLVDAIRPLAVEKEIYLRMDLPPETTTLAVDSARIKQAAQNLLSNAIHYTPQGGKVKIALKNSADEIMISVSDSGIGIAAEDLPHVFDRFYRIGTNGNREINGTGLGLAITKAIVEAHNGRVTVVSPGLEQGSTFTIYLPLDNDVQTAVARAVPTSN